MTPKPALRMVWTCTTCPATRLAAQVGIASLLGMGWRFNAEGHAFCKRCLYANPDLIDV